MKVGLTYNLEHDYSPYANAPVDFNGEFDSVEVIDAVEQSLASLGHQVCRIGDVHKLLHFLEAGQSVDLVFNMVEGFWGRSREAQVPAILEAFQIPYTFADPLTMAVTLDKGMTKRLLKQAHLPTHNFVVVSSLSQLNQTLPEFPLFVKPVHEGSSKGVGAESVVTSKQALLERVEWLLNWYQQPVLIEEYLPGAEFTVGILGNNSQAKVLGVAKLDVQLAGFVEKQDWQPHQFILLEDSPLKDKLSQIALQAYMVLECRDAGRVDIRLDQNNQPQILEINALPGLDPLYSFLPLIAKQAGLSFAQLITQIFEHAIARTLK